jgi:hypothetical protein
MKQRAAKIPAGGEYDLTEAIERMVRLYEAWNKPAEAVKWRKELDATKKDSPGEVPKSVEKSSSH